METIRINNKFKNVVYNKLFHCCSIILTNKHNLKVNDIINIQLVNPIKNIKNKIGKIYRIEKHKNKEIDKYFFYYTVEEMDKWQLNEYFDKDDELTIIHIQDIKDEK